MIFKVYYLKGILAFLRLLIGVGTIMEMIFLFSFSFEAFNLTLRSALPFLHNEGDTGLCISNAFTMFDDMRLISSIFQMYKKKRT